MSKEEFSNSGQDKSQTRRGGQKHGSFGGIGEEKNAGTKMQKEGAHSNTGIGDEKNPIGEEEGK